MNEMLKNENMFESIKHIDENGNEYWEARELQKMLEYSEWRKFKGVINKAIESCKFSNINVLDHFVGADKMVDIGSGAKRKQEDYKLSRYACYLIVQNSDPKYKAVALCQIYIATQTRKRELNEKEKSEDIKMNELATNLFIISQTEEKIKRDKIALVKKK